MSFEQIITWRNWKYSFEPDCIEALTQMEAAGVKPTTVFTNKNPSHLSTTVSDSLRMQTCYLSQDTDLQEFFLIKIWCNDPTLTCMVGGLKDAGILAKKTKYFGLSVLSLAILLQCDDIARAILSRLDEKSDVNSQDKAGWTAFHHAKVCAPKDIRKVLKDKGASKNVKNSFDATPSTLKKISTITKKDLGISLLFRKPGEDSDTQMDVMEFMESKHIKHFCQPPQYLVKTCKIAPLVLYDIWKMNNEGCFRSTRIGDLMISETLVDKYEYNPRFLRGLSRTYNVNKWEPFNPLIALRPVVKDDMEMPIKNPIGYGVFAAQPLHANHKVDNYAGTIEAPNSDPMYSLSIPKDNGRGEGIYTINASKCRSLAACINHGFPNAEFNDDEEGNSCVKTIRPVGKDEQVCVSYGRDYFEHSSSMVELRPKALEIFGKAHPLTEAYETFITGAPHEHFVCWNYIFIDTPVSFLRLILKNIYNKNQVRAFYNLVIFEKKILKKLSETFPKEVLRFCFNLVKKDEKLACLLADHLHYNCYRDKGSLEKELAEMNAHLTGFGR